MFGLVPGCDGCSNRATSLLGCRHHLAALSSSATDPG